MVVKYLHLHILLLYPQNAPFPMSFYYYSKEKFIRNSTNCDADFDAMLVQCKETTEKIQPTAANEITRVTTEPFQVDELDYQQPSVEQNLMRSNAITYVTGYLLKKCLQKHNCQVCSKSLAHQSELDSSNKLFCFFKAYDDKKSLYGGLTVQLPQTILSRM